MRRRLRGNAPVATFPTTVAGMRTGREVSSFPFRKSSARENPRHGNHAEIDSLHDLDFLMFSGAIVDPIAEREGKEKNNAAKNLDGIEFESGKLLARDYKHDDAHQKKSRPLHQPPPHHQLGRGGSQSARGALIGDAIGRRNRDTASYRRQAHQERFQLRLAAILWQLQKRRQYPSLAQP